jgi:hypothetical protein
MIPFCSASPLQTIRSLGFLHALLERLTWITRKYNKIFFAGFVRCHSYSLVIYSASANKEESLTGIDIVYVVCLKDLRLAPAASLADSQNLFPGDYLFPVSPLLKYGIFDRNRVRRTRTYLAAKLTCT